MEREYQLMLADGKLVVWVGVTGIGAAERYVAEHPGASVVAWRTWPRHGVFPHADGSRIID